MYGWNYRYTDKTQDISGRMTYLRKQDISDKTRDIHADKMRYLR